jgi:hypothetical protein
MFLTAFRDEFPKQPTLMFSVLSDAVPGDLDADDVRGRPAFLYSVV